MLECKPLTPPGYSSIIEATMNREAQKIRLFERVREISRWAPVRPEDRQDLIQEAWLLCLEYAGKRGKNLETVSNTEIKHRCYEAARQLWPKEITLTFEPAEDDFSEIRRAETEKDAVKKVADIEWILKNHPTIKLSPRQWEIYNELKNVTARTQNLWKAHYARKLGVTRQDIYNIERRVKRKVEIINDLSRFLQGDILYFLHKYSPRWPVNPIVRKAIIQPLRSAPVSNQIASRLRALHKEINNELTSFLNSPLQRNSDSIPRAAILDYFLDVHVLTDINSFSHSSLAAIKTPMPNNQFIDISVRNSLNYRSLIGDNSPFSEYNERIKYFIKYPDRESLRLAGYTICVYGITDTTHIHKYMESGGKVIPPITNPAPIIKSTYRNMREKFYASSEAAVDYNFLRMLLALKQGSSLPLTKTSRNTLKIICQKSRHSSDPFVVREAEKMLARFS